METDSSESSQGATPEQAVPAETIHPPAVEPDVDGHSDGLSQPDVPNDNPKTLVLFLDGTSNQFGERNTNIVKLAGHFSKKSPNLRIYYQPGIGVYTDPALLTPIAKYLAKGLDQAFALYLPTHIIQAYTFLMNTYTPGDTICMFGFSRGAYTARALVGMLETVGLVPPHNPELCQRAWDLYRTCEKDYGLEATCFKATFCRDVMVHFVGCFDTVSSVGFFKDRRLPFSTSSTITRFFRHALALSERRIRFQPVTWPKNDEADFRARQALSRYEAGAPRGEIHNPILMQALRREDKLEETRTPTNVKEVWFAGDHSDVGGSHCKDADSVDLSAIPLEWMLREFDATFAGQAPLNPVALAASGISLDLPDNGLRPVGPHPSMTDGRLWSDVTQSWWQESDATADTHDQLTVSDIPKWWIGWWMVCWPFWWLLECTICSSNRLVDGAWKTVWHWPNFGRSRILPEDYTILLHRSVLYRLRAGEQVRLPREFMLDEQRIQALLENTLDDGTCGPLARDTT